MDNRIIIKNDVFDIADRIKSIDRDYFIVYNKTKGVFEVHNSRIKPTLALTLPYSELDCRALNRVRITHISRLNETLKAIDEHNDRLEKSRFNESMDILNYKTKNLINYLDKGKSYLPNYEEI